MRVEWREPENVCPDCGGWKGEDFDRCRGCDESAREEAVGIAYHARRQETAKAVLYEIQPGFRGSSVWVPKSLLRTVDGPDLVGERRFYVPRWFAEQEGLI